MFLELENIPLEGAVLERAVGPERLAIAAEEFRLLRAVEVRGHVHRVDNEAYRLQGEMLASIEITCVRCLEPHRVDVREALDLLYLPHSKNVAAGGEEDRGLGEEELAVSFYRDEKIDLGHMVTEQLFLSLPMKPLCRPDCQGLCPECGTNRNVDRCGCVRDTTDPRWDGLRALLDS